MTSPEADADVSNVPVRSRRPALPMRALGGLIRFIRRSPLSAFWGCVAGAILIMAMAAPLVAPYDPLKSNFLRMNKTPNEQNWFGTDQIGRDTLSRTIHGSRISLTVAIAAVLLGTTFGAFWGLASGYFGGRFDIVSQRIIEFLQSFPDLILAMAIAMAPLPVPRSSTCHSALRGISRKA